MSFLNVVFGLFKRLVLLVLIVAIAVPIRYGSTDPTYLVFRLLHSVLTLKHSIVPDHARPTLSAEYRAFENILLLNPLPELDPSADPLTVIKELRLTLSNSGINPKPSTCKITKEVFQYDGQMADGFWVDNQPTSSLSLNSNKILLYVHGGGLISGDVHSKLFAILRK